MIQQTFIIVSIVAGVILSVFSNWLYDLLKGKNILPEKPTLKRSIIITIGFIPFLILVALPAFIGEEPETIESETKVLSTQELRASGSWIKIEEITPPAETSLRSGDKVSVVVIASYYLSGNGFSPEINLGYLQAYSPEENNSWRMTHFRPAKVGENRVRLSGTMIIPKISDLNGKPFEVEASIKVLDPDMGHVETVVEDRVVYPIVEN